ncbi:MAG: PRC-barrel domain-containing protein [Solirubrobacteraceae bacterium]
MDLGPAISYHVLPKGTKVLSSDGNDIGTVVHVLADESEDVFDGVVIDTRSGPGGHRFADADDVAEIHEDGLVLKLDQQACASLPEPSANPAVMSDDPANPERGESGEIQDKLRRAWDLLSGNY